MPNIQGVYMLNQELLANIIEPKNQWFNEEPLFKACDNVFNKSREDFKELFLSPAMNILFLYRYIKSSEDRKNLLLSAVNSDASALKSFVKNLDRKMSSHYNVIWGTRLDGIEEEFRQFSHIKKMIITFNEIIDSGMTLAANDKNEIFSIYIFIILSMSKQDTVFISTVQSSDSHYKEEYPKFLKLCADTITKYTEYLTNPDVSNTNKSTLLHVLIDGDNIAHLYAIKILLQKQAKVTLRNDYGLNPLMVATTIDNKKNPMLSAILNSRPNLTAADLESALLYGLRQRARYESMPQTNVVLLTQALCKDSTWNNYLLLTNGEGGLRDRFNESFCTYFDDTKYRGMFSLYLSLLKKPLSDILNQFEPNQKSYNELIAFIICNAFFYQAENNVFNDVLTYMASRSQACANLRAAQGSYIEAELRQRYEHRNVVDLNELESKLVSKSNDGSPSPLETAAKNNNVHFFILILQCMAPLFSSKTKQCIQAAILDMSIVRDQQQMQPLTDYLSQYAAQHSYPFNSLISFRIDLKNAISKLQSQKKDVEVTKPGLANKLRT